MTDIETAQIAAGLIYMMKGHKVRPTTSIAMSIFGSYLMLTSVTILKRGELACESINEYFLEFLF